MLKKIYIEITNQCNLNCDFCIKNSREIKFMNINEFKLILNKLKNHTKFLYFHVLGEPLIHPKINEFIEIASKDYFINITTNGYLLNNLTNLNIRQINISLHSYNPKYEVDLDTYLNNIFKFIDRYKKNTYISLRFWVNNKYNQLIIDLINKKYKTNITILKNGIKIIDNVFISIEEEFIWPDLENNFNNNGTCYALRDHIGILVDGTIIPCCLDSKGIINLGNIFKEDLDTVLNQERVKKMIEGFQNQKRIELLCKKCGYLIKSKI